MKATIEIDLEAFSVPNFVRTKSLSNDEEGTAISIKDLDPLTLDRLCNEFRAQVFKKAGKQEPPQAVFAT